MRSLITKLDEKFGHIKEVLVSMLKTPTLSIQYIRTGLMTEILAMRSSCSRKFDRVLQNSINSRIICNTSNLGPHDHF